MEVRNIDVRKLSDEEKVALVKKYVDAGWQTNSEWRLSVHQWLSFTWPHDGKPPEI